MGAQAVAGLRAVVVHGNEDFYERNGIARKLTERGVQIVRVYQVATPNQVRKQDWSKCDFVVSIESMLDNPTSRAVREQGAVLGIRVVPLQHRTSGSDWRELELVTGKAGPDPANEVVVELPARKSPTTKASAADAVKKVVEDSEALAEMAVEENSRLHAEVARLGKLVAEKDVELEGVRHSIAAQARDQLAADVARKEGERVAAVREVTRLARELEAEQALRRKAEADLLGLQSSKIVAEQEASDLMRDLDEANKLLESYRKTPLPSAPANDMGTMRKLRAILNACGEGVLTNDEAVAKIAAVLS
jgi:hypothetical protein